jgi:hypothetical protein
VVRGSWFVVRGSWFVVRGSWFVVRGSWFVVRGSWFVVRGSWLLYRTFYQRTIDALDTVLVLLLLIMYLHQPAWVVLRGYQR